MNKTVCRVLVAFILTLGALAFPLTHTNISTAPVEGATNTRTDKQKERENHGLGSDA